MATRQKMISLTTFFRRAYNAPLRILDLVLSLLPYFAFIRETKDTRLPITFGMWFRQNIRGINHGPYWPVDPSSRVVGWRNVLAGVETSPGIMPGCYIQGLGKITIGDYTAIGPNVGIISSNHSFADLREHNLGSVKIGRYCWIGMGAIILPDVILGDFTMVGAGAVVTRSFPHGKCLIAGNPAKLIRTLPEDACKPYRSKHEYHGFIRHADFPEFALRELLQ